MKIKKLMSLSTLCVVGVLGVGLLTGCNNDNDKDVPSDDVDDTETETVTGPQSVAVLNNALNMLSGFTFEGSIDIAYGDIEIGLEFSNGEAVIPLDLSDFSFDLSKLAVGGDLTIVYDSYSITLGVTYLDSAVYVDYGEDSYWSEGVGDSVHFYMENSDIGDLINLFSSDDEEASSVDWEELFGIDLSNIGDIIDDLYTMSLTTAKDGSPAFALSLESLGIDDSILIRTNDNSECTGLECTEVELGEFTLSIDLSLATKKGLEVTTREEISEYVDLACVNGIVNAVYDIMEYKYFHLTGEISLGAWYGTLGETATIETTIDMRIAEDGTFTMLIDCDIPIVTVNFVVMEVGITDGGGLTQMVYDAGIKIGSTVLTPASWSTVSGAESRHTTVYYDSEEGNTYFYRKDIGVGHTYTPSCSIDTDNPTADDYTVNETFNTYEQWGMLSGSEFVSNPISYILDNMIGCGELIASALGGSGEEGSFDFEFVIPNSLNGLITEISVASTDESETVVTLGLSLGSMFGGDASMLDELSIVLTLTESETVSSISIDMPIVINLGDIMPELASLGSVTFAIGVDLSLDESSSKTLESVTPDPFAEFEAYIAAHTCTCEECNCEEGECDEECECCSEDCECYFIQDTIVERLWLDESLPCSCGCESCVLGQCNCAEGSCECSDDGCACTTDDGGDTEPDDENP